MTHKTSTTGANFTKFNIVATPEDWMQPFEMARNSTDPATATTALMMLWNKMVDHLNNAEPEWGEAEVPDDFLFDPVDA
jgi:hypothetical protein